MPRHHFEAVVCPMLQSLPIEPESSNEMNMSIGALQFAGFASPLEPLEPSEVPELPKPPLDDPPPLDVVVPLLEPKSLSPASDPQATTTPIPPTTATTASMRARRLMLAE